jgi:SAM-dependent methyltransferase
MPLCQDEPFVISDPYASRDFYNTIARYYDAENEAMTDDLALYNELADESNGPILDVGCGTGRVSLHLAAGGHRVVGIDASVAMLERGRRKLKNRIDLADLVTFYEGNALDFQFPEKFRLVVIPYNTLMHFCTADDQMALIRHMGQLLDDDGLIVIDLPNAGEVFATLDDGSVTLERSFTEPESGNLVMQQSVSRINRTDQLQFITWIYDEIATDGVVRRTVAPLTLRYVFPTELDLLLRINGLECWQRFGDYDQEPFAEGCERLIMLARKTTRKAESKA